MEQTTTTTAVEDLRTGDQIKGRRGIVRVVSDPVRPMPTLVRFDLETVDDCTPGEWLAHVGDVVQRIDD